MGKQAGLLDDVAHLQPERGGVDTLRIGAIHEDAPAVGIDETVDHAQRRGLAAAGRSDQDACLAVGDFQREVQHRVGAARETLAHVLQADHRSINVSE